MPSMSTSHIYTTPAALEYLQHGFPSVFVIPPESYSSRPLQIRSPRDFKPRGLNISTETSSRLFGLSGKTRQLRDNGESSHRVDALVNISLSQDQPVICSGKEKTSQLNGFLQPSCQYDAYDERALECQQGTNASNVAYLEIPHPFKGGNFNAESCSRVLQDIYDQRVVINGEPSRQVRVNKNDTSLSYPQSCAYQELVGQQFEGLFVNPLEKAPSVKEANASQNIFIHPAQAIKHQPCNPSTSPLLSSWQSINCSPNNFSNGKFKSPSFEPVGNIREWGQVTRWLYITNFPTNPAHWRLMKTMFELATDLPMSYITVLGMPREPKVTFVNKRHPIIDAGWKFDTRPEPVPFTYPSIKALDELINDGYIRITWKGSIQHCEEIYKRFEEMGEIKSSTSAHTVDECYMYIEYDDTRAARTARETLNGQVFEHVFDRGIRKTTTVRIEYYDYESQTWDAVADDFRRLNESQIRIPPAPRRVPVVDSRSSEPDFRYLVDSRVEIHHSLKGQIAEDYVSHQRKYPPPVTSTVRSSGNRAIPEGNVFDLEKVKKGLDERTTFMIRNIPNKYTQEMFLDWLNKTHKGKYDFAYLRKFAGEEKPFSIPDCEEFVKAVKIRGATCKESS
ncbi:4573_t:CDS:10 [Acaulospora colombiana]|uniref:4573_t:CDS:1 n=1 Tax=Acaulospora colombiana TaxID=27376 RepID=A0ACA9K2S5_9GLOM|nr:4573_t:CDS:10 [Acaulospora colombiana]